MQWFSRRLRRSTTNRFRPLLTHLESRVNPTQGFVVLSPDLMFSGDYSTLTNPSGGTDYTFTGDVQLGWNPPNGDTDDFSPLYTYSGGGSLMFNSSGNAPVNAPATTNTLPTGQNSFILNGGTLSTIPILDSMGNTLYPSVAVESGDVQYVGETDFVNGGLSLEAPLTIDFGKYVHITVNSIGFGAAPTLNGGAVDYDPQLALRGGIVVGTTGANGKNVEFDVNGTSYLGVGSDGFTLTGATASVSGSFSIDEITITVSGAGLGYSAASGSTPPQLSFFGAAKASFAEAFDLNLNVGSSNDPGLIINLGTDPGLEKLQFSAGGESKLDNVKIEFNALNFEYLPETATEPEQYAVGGGVEVILTKQLTVEVELGENGQPGLTVEDGLWVLDGFAIKVANVTLPGGWGLKDLQFSFETDTSDPGGYDISGQVEVKVPAGFSIGGGLGFTDGSLSSIEIDYDVSEGEGFLRLPGTGLYVSSLHGSLENLDQLSDLQISAAVSVAYGPSFTLPTGSTTYEIARANVTGTFSSSEIYLSGGVYFLAKQTTPAPGASSTSPTNPNSPDYNPAASGYDSDSPSEAPANNPEQNLQQLPQFNGVLGSGSATFSVNFADSSGVVTANASLIGGIIRANFQFTIDDELDIYSTGNAGAYFPQAIPIVGGTEIAGAGFEFKWDNEAKTGTIAAATKVINTVLGFEYQIENYDGNANDFSIIYSGPFSGAFNGTKTYTLQVNPTDYLNGATDALFTVDYNTPGLLDALTITDPNGTVSTYSNNSFAPGPITVIPNQPANQVVFSFAGSSTNAYETLLDGQYTITVTTSAALPSAPQLSMNASITPPAVTFGNLPKGSSQGLLTVPVSAQTGATVQSKTNIYLYADLNSTGYDGVLIGTASLSEVSPPATAGGVLDVDIEASFRGLLPLQYFLYAIIDDGTNPAVTSAYAASSVQADQEIFGFTTNSQDQGIPGLFLWIDGNGDGEYEPPTQNPDGTITVTDPATWSAGGNGAFSFPRTGDGDLSLMTGQQYTMYLDLPDGFTFVSTSLQGTPTVTPAGSNRPARVSVPFSYNPPMSISFVVQQAPTISGTVVTAANSGTVGLQGVKVYVDLNNNGQFDSGSEPSTITDLNGQYRLLPLTAGQSYTVALALASNQQLATGASGSQMVAIPSTAGTGLNTPIVTAQNFQVIRNSVISGNVSGYALTNGGLGSTTTNLAGWTVQLKNASGTVLQTTTTDASGNYSFDPVAPNVSYQVTQIPPNSTGWRQITPQATTPTFAFQSIDTSDYGEVLSVASGQFNDDGITDYVATIKNSKSLYFWMSNNTNGTPGFTVVTMDDIAPGKNSPEQAQDNLMKVVAGEYFGEGLPALYVLDRSNYVYLLGPTYQNESSTGFLAAARYNFTDVPSGTAGMDLVVGDFDGDGQEDFAFSAQGVNNTQNDPYVVIQTAAFIQNQGASAGSFSFKTSETWFEQKLNDNGGGGLAVGYLGGPNDVAADLIANVNNNTSDGYPFIVTIPSPPNSPPTPVLSSLAGTASYSPGQAAVGYIDSDPDLDVVLAYPGLGSGTAVFGPIIDDLSDAPTQSVGVLGGPSAVYSLPTAVADLNLDGLADMAYAVSAYEPGHNQIDGSPTVASPLVVYLNQLAYGSTSSTPNNGVPYSTSLSTTFDLSSYNLSSSSPVQVSEVRTTLLTGYPTLAAGTPLSKDTYPDLTIAMQNSNYFLIAYNTTIPIPNTLTVVTSPTFDETGVDFVNEQNRSFKIPVVTPLPPTPSPSNTVGGIVFDDTNRDGIYQPVDKVRSGVQLYLDLNGDGSFTTGEPTRTTNQFGAYAFGDLPNGTYTVRTMHEANRKITTPAGEFITVTLNNGEGGIDADFGSIVAKDLVVQTGTSKGGDWVVSQVGPFLRVLDTATNSLVVNEFLTDVNSLRIDGTTGAADSVTIDFASGGSFTLPGGIKFNAGGDTGDSLDVLDAAAKREVVLSPQSVRIDGMKIGFSGVKAINLDTGLREDTVRITAAPGTKATTATVDGVTTVNGLTYSLTVTDAEHLILPPAAPSVVAVGNAGGSVRLVDGSTGKTLLANFRPLDVGAARYTGNISVALGDLNGDGVADLFVSATEPLGANGLAASKAGAVFVYDGATLAAGQVPTAAIRKFIPFATTSGPVGSKGAYTNGLNIAVADLNGDGTPDLIAGTRGGTPTAGRTEFGRFVVIDGSSTVGNTVQLGNIVSPFGSGYTKGVVVAGGDLDGDGKAEIAVTRGGPVAANNSNKSVKLKVFQLNGVAFTELNLTGTGAAFAPFAGVTAANGDVIQRDARVTIVDTTGDGKGELVFTALDRITNPSDPQVRVAVFEINTATGLAAAISTGTGPSKSYLVGAAVKDHAIGRVNPGVTEKSELSLATESASTGVVYLDSLTGAVLPGGFALKLATGGITLDGV